MSEFAADRGSRVVVERPLINRQGIRCRATGNRCPPASDFKIALLGVVVPQTVELGHSGTAKLSLVTM